MIMTLGMVANHIETIMIIKEKLSVATTVMHNFQRC